MRVVFLCLILSFVLKSHSQVKHKSISELGNRIDYYMSNHQTDSVYICISDFLQRKDIDTVEMFYGHLFFGQAYFQSKKINEGFEELQKCLEFTNNNAYSKYKSKAYEKMAEEYFTLLKYDSAQFYAEKCLALTLQHKISNYQYNLAMCYNILGYCSYLKKDYDKAIAEFQKSVDNYSAIHYFCDIPLVYCKIAKVYNSQGKKDKAEELVNQAIYISDTCHAEENVLVCKYAKLEIYKENHDYEKALASLEDINKMVEKLEKDKQFDKIDELDIQYKTKLKDYENNSLKQINQKNKEVVSKQKQALIISIIAIILMTFLSLWVSRALNFRKKAMKEVEDKNREIEKKNKELERLHVLNQKIFSVISHDFKGPMLSLQLLLDTFEKESANPTSNHYIHDVSNQLMYANQILDNLLNWARTEINLGDESEANPYNVAFEIINQFKGIADKKQIHISNEIPPYLVLQIPPDVLRIVFRNLISNAIKYSFDNSSIRIYYDEHLKHIIVKDNGIGIKEGKLKRLFIKDIETSLGTRKEAGFGLGLYITHELLHRFGGEIKVNEHVQKGAEFILTIPTVHRN